MCHITKCITLLTNQSLAGNCHRPLAPGPARTLRGPTAGQQGLHNKTLFSLALFASMESWTAHHLDVRWRLLASSPQNQSLQTTLGGRRTVLPLQYSAPLYSACSRLACEAGAVVSTQMLGRNGKTTVRCCCCWTDDYHPTWRDGRVMVCSGPRIYSWLAAKRKFRLGYKTYTHKHTHSEHSHKNVLKDLPLCRTCLWRVTRCPACSFDTLLPPSRLAGTCLRRPPWRLGN